MSDESRYWDSKAEYGRNASVIDPRDRLGRKNSYIARIRNDTLLRELAMFSRGASVLDFGCGPGNMTRILRSNGYYAIGIDISVGLLALGKESTEVATTPYILFDGKTLPLADQTVDAVITYVVLNHIVENDDLAAVLREIRRVLRPGGCLLAMEQIRRRDTYDSSRHSHRRSIATFSNLFRQAGFELLRNQTVRYGHFPGIYLIRYGLVPVGVDRMIAASERLFGRLHPVPWFDYADVLFVMTKRT